MSLMEDTVIEMPQNIPDIKSKKCRFVAFLLEMFLTYIIYIISLVSWYFYDYFIAFLILLLSFIIIGIIRSKIRNIVIPQIQSEYLYSDKDIAKLYTAKMIC